MSKLTATISTASASVMLASDLSPLTAAVRIEAGTAKDTGSLYADSARHIAALFAIGDQAAIHLFMCQAQDLTTDPGVWNRVASSLYSGTRNALSALPEPLVMVAKRDFRPTHRQANPLFEVATKASVKAARDEARKVADEKAQAIEAQGAADRAAAMAAADAEVTPYLMAAATLAECTRLGFSPADIVTVLAECAAKLMSVNAGYTSADWDSTLSPLYAVIMSLRSFDADGTPAPKASHAPAASVAVA